MIDEEIVNEEFNSQINSLKETYKQSTLKEKHKLNEHIKNILKAHGTKLTEEIESYLKINSL